MIRWLFVISQDLDEHELFLTFSLLVVQLVMREPLCEALSVSEFAKAAVEDFHGSERRNGGSFFKLSTMGALGEHV